MDRLTQLLSTLATDSNRRRGKAERKVQRSAFRDILKTVEVSIIFLHNYTNGTNRTELIICFLN
jgi:hypothetical protein